MRKVGIITLFDADNYGNRLQAYALARTLQKQNCQVVETFRCSGFVSMVKGKIKTSRLARTILELIRSISARDKHGIGNCRRLGLFFDFMKRTRVKHARANDPTIDCFVCGSDQIWNPACGGTPFYFADFAPKEKSIAYAASFGVDTLPADVAANYAGYLHDMAHISVREQAGAKLVQDLANRDVPVVVDPTLLLNREEWKTLAKKPSFPVHDRYILTYFLGWHTADIDAYIKRISQEQNMQIISLNHMNKDHHWFCTGPAEFLWLIEHASLVCTNSFHATVFSLIFNTPFVNFKRNSTALDMNSRIDTLLNTMQLNDRVYGRLNDECLFEINFDHIPDILEGEKKRSIAYLRNALNLDPVTE